MGKLLLSKRSFFDPEEDEYFEQLKLKTCCIKRIKTALLSMKVI